jgi:hypothetical protein
MIPVQDTPGRLSDATDRKEKPPIHLFSKCIGDEKVRIAGLSVREQDCDEEILLKNQSAFPDDAAVCWV